MIDKKEFYHGPPLLRLIEDRRFQKIRPKDGGYVVNGGQFVLIKYSTRGSSPWQFTFSDDEIDVLAGCSKSNLRAHIALVCGGDGICAESWVAIRRLLGGSTGAISCRRPFNKQYAVSGPLGGLTNKVPLNRWPEILFTDALHG